MLLRSKLSLLQFEIGCDIDIQEVFDSDLDGETQANDRKHHSN